MVPEQEVQVLVKQLEEALANDSSCPRFCATCPPTWRPRPASRAGRRGRWCGSSRPGGSGARPPFGTPAVGPISPGDGSNPL